MAGEFPDRSKQHESSAEPTSGSRVPVPDPRLAVAREAVPAAARADTVTAVFSTKRSAESAGSTDSAGAEGEAEPAAGSSLGSDGSAEPEPEPESESEPESPAEGAGGGDGRLRSAVAAWAATADEEAPEGAPAGAGADPGAPEGAKGASAGTKPEADADGAAPEAAEAAESAPSTDSAARGAFAGDADSGSDSGADVERDSGRETDAGSSVEGASAGDGGDADVDRDPDRDTDAGGLTRSGSAEDADSDADVSADRGSVPGEARAEAAAADRATEDADEAEHVPLRSGTSASGESAGGVAAAKAGSKADASADPERTAATTGAQTPAGEAPSGGASDADADADADPASVTAQGRAADADPVGKSDSAGKPDPAATPTSAAHADADGEPDDTAKPDSAAAPGPVAAARPAGKRDAAAKPGLSAKQDAAAKPDPSAKPGPGATSAPAGDADSAGKTGSTAEPDTAAAHADSAGRPDGVAKPDAGGESDSAATSDAAAGSGPAESGAPSGEGRPESKPPVDQATAIFKRPPAVDQPTTMLKLGDAKPEAGPGKDAGPGKTAASEGDGDAKGGSEPAGEAETAAPAERTSKFVALKPLDEPAPPKARPAVPPPGPSAPPAASPTAAVPQVGPERTTQQPLPPRPPLDLLAELTNTPPPRQTPVRTLVRRVKIWTPLVLLLAVVFAVVQVVRPLPTPTLALTADETYAFKGDKVSLPWPEEGQGWMDVNGVGTVDSFGDQKPVAIGSVAKAMTAYVILKEHPLKAGADGAKIPVDAKAETEGGYDAQGESTLNTVKKGDTLTEKDAIAAIMIPSANNIARLLARWDAGSEAKFVEKMNAAAKDLGMKNTKYTDPSGLKETTVSTAEDQVKLGNELVDIKALVDITKLPTWVDPSGKKWDNYNRLVPYNNAIGIKTGSTTKAGGNLLFAATQEVGGENVIVVGAILGQHTPPIIDTVNAVSKTAMIAAQEALTSRKILKKGDVVGYVDDGLGGRTPVVATKDVSAVGWAGQTVKLKLDEGGEAIPHEAKAGTEVGSLSVGDGTTGDAVDVPVALQSDLAEPAFGAKLTRVG
ncbi:D-alanyl-D-alanine carboxypeptidase [Streptomyces sp. NPDC020707]|uniref:D-alanyl-D-alanine carboxypeptidase n=1 Tax=Streptomyces sp. NPDC020707 TaxID=3365084 RepID=UPI003796230E